MTMMIGVTNSSKAMRSGAVSVSWDDLTASENPKPRDVAVVKPNLVHGVGDVVRSQIDRVDPADPARAVVSMYIEDVPANFGVPPLMFRPDYRSAQQASGPVVLHTRREHSPPEPIDENDPAPKEKIELKNEYIHASVHIPKGPFGWQGGAVTSVRIYNREILDAFKAEEGWENQDREKRVQLDYVSVARPPWSKAPVERFALFDKDWRYVASGAGPVRAFVTIESPPFTVFHGPDGLKESDAEHNGKYDDVRYDCHLYRVISLYHRADYLVEEIYVRGKRRSDGAPVSLSFSTHYFLKMRVGEPPPTRRIPDNDWFAIGSTGAPFQGYGFAATVSVGRIENPPDDYPNEKEKWSAFGWAMGYGREVRSLHLFKRGLLPHQLADETGRHWFDVIYNPMRANLHH